MQIIFCSVDDALETSEKSAAEYKSTHMAPLQTWVIGHMLVAEHAVPAATNTAQTLVGEQ